MTTTGRTARAAVWSVATGVGSRLLSLGSTLVLTRYLAPAVYGQVSVAYVVTSLASLASSLGVPQFVASRPDASKSELFQASAAFHIAGAVALALVWIFRSPLGIAFGAEGVEPFMLGFVIATALERVGQIPESMLVRDIRFRELGLIGAAGEVVYSVTALAAVWRGAGAQSLVYAAVVRAAIKTLLLLRATDRREWTSVHPLNRAQLSSLLSFGMPLVFARLSSVIARRGDNLAFGMLFGTSRLGAYNLAYNLADVPATTVGEKIGDVLVPSFAKLPVDQRPAAFRRSLPLLSLAVFPLAAGISAVARPLAEYLDSHWRSLDIRWMLVILCLLSVARPIDWVARIYLQVAGLTRTIMGVEWARAAAVIGGIFLAGRWGPLAACGAVGAVFVVLALVYLAYAARAAQLSFWALVKDQVGPLAAVLTMWGAVMALDKYVFLHLSTHLTLVLDIICGAVAYGIGAAIFCKSIVASLVEVAKRARNKTPPAG
ncbi:MAG: oligosaccharide flippase family protein [Polyangiaceae bacterium]|nr:oligosaccharide flippase family protein [Polyangiaceae bacterium]